MGVKCVMDVVSSHIVLIGQFFLSLTIVAFCIGMLASQTGSDAVYLPMIAAIVDIWLPQPQTCPSPKTAACSTTTPLTETVVAT